jgi:hypothetical protein
VPIYFGRVGSFVVENRHLTTADAEERVERQARQFELLKPYLVKRWAAVGGAAVGGAAANGSTAGEATAAAPGVDTTVAAAPGGDEA